jgi:recombination protein RecA
MEEKDKAIKEALAKIQKKYGKDSVIDMSMDESFEVEAVSSGCFSLDYALGCGGLPKGRLIEVFGQESSGKSTLAMFLMAQIQKAGGRAALIDAEFAFSSDYAEAIGVDIRKLLVSQPSTLEEAMDTIKFLVESNSVDIIVLDSIASLVPKAELEGEEMLKADVAMQAKLLNKALRILTGPISKSKTVVIFINQLREKIGVIYGRKEYTPGGKALKFYASVRIEVKKGDKIEDKNGRQIGNWMKIDVVKNKVGMPWTKAEFELYYEKGVDLVGDALDFGETIDVITRSGNSYSYGDKKLGVGRDNAKNFLIKNPDLLEEIRQNIQNKLNEDKN